MPRRMILQPIFPKVATCPQPVGHQYRIDNEVAAITIDVGQISVLAVEDAEDVLDKT